MVGGPWDPVDAPRSAWWRRPRYLWLFPFALLLRAGVLLELRGSPVLEATLGDAAVYDAWARQLADGDWVGQGVFYQSPLYPYLVGVMYWLAGPNPMAVRYVQVLAGAAACVLLAKAAERLLASRAGGWAAGLMLALCPMAIFFDLILQKSALDLFLVCLVLWTVSRLETRRTREAVLALGAAGGLFVLNRENALLPVLALLGWVAWTSRAHQGRAVQSLGLALLGAALVLSPVLLRNRLAGGEWHLTTSQSGPNFYIGNHPGASGTYEPLRVGRGDARFERQDATELAEAAMGRRLSPGEVSAYWRGRALTYIREQPRAWLALMGKKSLLTINPTELGDTEDLYTWSEYSRLLQALSLGLHMGVLFPLAAAGAAAAWPRRGALAPVYLMILCYAGSVVLFYVLARYRYPLVPMLIVLAAGVFAAPWRTWLGERRYLRVILPLACAAAASLLVNLGVYPQSAIRAASHSNLGVHFAGQGRFDRAIPHLIRAVELDPASDGAYYNLGLALYQAGHLPQAENVLTQGVGVAPGNAQIRRLRDEVRERRTASPPGAPRP